MAKGKAPCFEQALSAAATITANSERIGREALRRPSAKFLNARRGIHSIVFRETQSSRRRGLKRDAYCTSLFVEPGTTRSRPRIMPR